MPEVPTTSIHWHRDRAAKQPARTCCDNGSPNQTMSGRSSPPQPGQAGGTGMGTRRSSPRKSQRVQGIYVGSRKIFADMNRAISLHSLKPIIHEVFKFEEAPAAYRAMEDAGHFGKLVISV